MKEDNMKEVICYYDLSSDILGIKVNHDFSYEETVEMDDGMLLDFDVNNVPVSLEVLDASQRFNLPKESLNNIVCFEMDVFIDEKSISINAKIGVLINNVENNQFFKSHASNYGNFPNASVQLALV
ncbi:DUF2283 domain-containing protein [Methanobrevibacter sp.]|uniref:DUF2283 domain-containing protein n=1 Tax=Methanobrevibacter sp. TaxID=66852 RepID=UPI00386E567C